MKRENTYHHGDLRAELVKAARKHLERGGYEALSLRDLARETGVAASAPYAHFKGRDDLFNALIQEGARTLASSFGDAAALLESPRQRLAAACRAYLDFSRRKREMFRLMFASPVLPSPVFESDVRAVLDQFESLVAASLGTEDGLATRAVALACWSTMHGFAMLRLHRRLTEAVANDSTDDLIVDAVLRLATRADVERVVPSTLTSIL